ncbi:transposase, partial [Nocardioides sp.]|uniref:transposase n=1 Tax=Nocardioides sp. TaxID=35761 RepID=UPI0026324CED
DRPVFAAGAKYLGMARSYRPVVRDQEFLLPPNMADWLPEDHLVWFVLDVVEQLDTASFHRTRRTGGVGRRGYDPDMLLALLIYAYAVGERSSRRIERLCADHVAFRVICAADAPDHTTIARFRAEHQDAFVEVFTQVLRLCAAAGMVKVGIVAIDGTKIAANAARGANRSADSIREQARTIAQQILDEAAVTDTTEDHAAAAAGRDGSDDGLPPGFASRSGRAANVKRALEELERQDVTHEQADAADAERAEDFLRRVEAGEVIRGGIPAGVDPVAYHRARIQRLERLLVGLVGVPGPTASSTRREARRKLKAAHASLDTALARSAAGNTDLRGVHARKRHRQEQQARARGGTGPSVNRTDPDSRLMTCGSGGGSVQGYNAQFTVTDDHLILGVHASQDANDKHCYLPALAAATTQADTLGLTIGTVLADAGYFTETNITAPGPDRLIAPGKNHHLHTTTDAPIQPPPPKAGPLELMRHRLTDPANIATYKRRSATVEPVIAHIKDQVGLRRFARRGLHAITAELHLAAAAVNLQRLHNNALTT